MPSTYTPSAVALTPITLPSDGDSLEAADVNVPLEALADGITFLGAHLKIQSVVITATDASGAAFVAPVTGFALILAYGGGSGGGGGEHPSLGNDVYVGGGSGGAGAIQSMQLVPIVLGTGYDVTIGDGGVGGAANSDGNDGTDTLFAVHGGATLATFPGAKHGKKQANSGDATHVAWATGGSPTKGGAGGTGVYLAGASIGYDTAAGPGFGGAAFRGPTAQPANQAGYASAQGYTGGAAGANGTDNASTRGGGGGGGGGAGPGGIGGDAGAGGNAGGAGPGANGSNGTSAAANTGAGGGGAGSGGGSSTSAGTGGTAGDGGSGQLTIIYLAAA